MERLQGGAGKGIESTGGAPGKKTLRQKLDPHSKSSEGREGGPEALEPGQGKGRKLNSQASKHGA